MKNKKKVEINQNINNMNKSMKNSKSTQIKDRKKTEEKC